MLLVLIIVAADGEDIDVVIIELANRCAQLLGLFAKLFIGSLGTAFKDE